MHLINHRINTLEQLSRVPTCNGCELDLRYHKDELILHHDPFAHHSTQPTRFSDFLEHYKLAGPMILNIKTEGIEALCIELMRQHGIDNWFFLDLSMPFFVIYTGKAAQGAIDGFTPENLAVRFSEHEPIEYALNFAGKASWVWVDCFSQLPLTRHSYDRLKRAGFKICLVSPELQKHSTSMIDTFRASLNSMPVDAVCTKRPDLWGQKTSAALIDRLELDCPSAN